MVLVFWLLLLLAGICFLLLMPSLLGLTIFQRYRGIRMVTCPQTHGSAAVRIDARHAALTGMASTEKLRLEACTLWPRPSCNQDCLAEAVSVPPIPPFRTSIKHHFVVHIPAWLASALVFWVIGLFWYSDRYLFRSQWTGLAGYSPSDVKYLAGLWAPHLATVVVALICTLGIAIAMELLGRHGVKNGIAVGFLFWLALWVVLVSVILFSDQPLGLIWIHGGYTLIACLAAGAILGAWTPGRVMRWLDRE